MCNFSFAYVIALACLPQTMKIVWNIAKRYGEKHIESLNNGH